MATLTLYVILLQKHTNEATLGLSLLHESTGSFILHFNKYPSHELSFILSLAI